MKISEMQDRLAAFKKYYGDVECEIQYPNHNASNGMFSLIPEDVGRNEKTVTVIKLRMR